MRICPLAPAIACVLAPSLLAAPQCDPVLHPSPTATQFDWWGHGLDVDGARVAVSGGSEFGDQDFYIDIMLTGSSGLVHEERIQASGGTPSRFGHAFDLDGDRILIGAPREADQGRAYVYERSGGVWLVAGVLQLQGASSGSEFGARVLLDGDRAFVSAPGSALGRGGVYPFTRSASGTWQPGATIVPAAFPAGGRFGEAFDVEGDRLVASGDGRVHVFENGPLGWQQAATLDAPAGESLVGATLGGDLVVSSWGTECFANGVCPSGNVRVFEHTAAGWAVADDLTSTASASTQEIETHLGRQAIIDGDDLYLYAHGLVVGDPAGQGPAGIYRFERRSGGWEQTLHWTTDEWFGRVDFGAGMALADDRLWATIPASSMFADYSGALAVYGTEYGIEQFCFGLGCPCGVDVGTGGCPGSTTHAIVKANSAQLAACGTTSVGADDLELHASWIPAQQFGLVVMAHAAATPMALADGLLCLDAAAPGLGRLPVQQADANGRMVTGPGLGALSVASLGGNFAITAGATWCFQLWYRDPAGACGHGANVTNGVRVTFRP